MTVSRSALSRRPFPVALLLPIAAFVLACTPAEAPPTPQDATAFVAEAEAQLLESWIDRERAGWVQQNFITGDTELMAASASEETIKLTVKLAQEAARFSDLELDADLARKLDKLKLSLTLPAPSNEDETRELAQIAAGMESTYSASEYCGEDGECRNLTVLSNVMRQSRDAGELLDAWRGWRTISPPMRADYQRFAELGNKGAQELGFADLGAMWRSKYDMDPDAFAAELDRLWDQVKPLYEALHCHVRAKLAEVYGDAVDPEGPIPAHLLGNMWAQTWSNVYDLVAPAGVEEGYDLTRLLEAEGLDELEMVRYGERFFTSLGFEPLPETFWERSLFVRPEDRDVVCHASAGDLDDIDGVRSKMGIGITDEDFVTVHHELGHNVYRRA